MAAKEIDLPNLGKVRLYKRRDLRNIKISLQPDGSVRVSLPRWAPYKAGVDFVKSKQDWINQHKHNVTLLEDGQLIAKRHRLFFVRTQSTEAIKARIKNNAISILYPSAYTTRDHQVQLVARKAATRAIRQEAKDLLPERLNQLSLKTGLQYNGLKFKSLKSRWGSCSPQKDITLNIFLIQLPWELIDYVIIHELIHTKILSHGQDFWKEFNTHYADPKKYRKLLRDYHPVI